MRKKVEVIFARSDKELTGSVNNYLYHHKDESPRVVSMTTTYIGEGRVQFHCMIETTVLN